MRQRNLPTAVTMRSWQFHLEIEILTGQMKVASYVSNVDFVLHKVEDEAEELTHCSNNEELAISFGNLNTGSGTCIQISNDLFAW